MGLARQPVLILKKKATAGAPAPHPRSTPAPQTPPAPQTDPTAGADSAALAAAFPSLLAFYDRERRHLPWREEPTPYRVWVSEIMLQQTRVEAVKPYFDRFMTALPDIHALAACPPDALRKLWEGLGYYSRVRNLQRAAELVVRDFGGELPRDPQALLTLPGIGSYTAGAIAAFAYGLPAPAVDGNVLRVLARFFADGRNVLDPRVKTDFERTVAAALRGAERPGDIGQALIELGATVCTPLSPACTQCPWQELCRARQEGAETTLPRREKKTARREETRTVLLLSFGGRYLIRRRPDRGLLASLFEFPSLDGAADEETIRAHLAARGLTPAAITPAPTYKHIFTHLVWHLHGVFVDLPRGDLPEETPLAFPEDAPPSPDPGGDCLLLTPERIRGAYPLPSAFAPLTAAILSRKGDMPCSPAKK